MIIIKAKDYKDMSRKAALIILNEIMLNDSLSIGFATGSTPLGLYEELIKSFKYEQINLSNITTFNLDEYFPIKKKNKQSYHHFMFENFFNYVNVDKKNIHFLDGETKNSYDECKEFDELIEKTGIDLQILGIGRNGHIGFNEPGSSFDSKTRVVELDSKTIKDNSRFFKDSKEVPRKALTMGLSTIMSSRKILLLASGKNKSDAVKKMIEGPVNENCPASILQKHPNVIVMIDDSAASLLSIDSIPSEIAGYHIFNENNLPKNKVIVSISPHPDDSSVGPGGTLALLSKNNKVYNIVMTTGHRSFIPDTSKEERIYIREKETLMDSSILKYKTSFLKLSFYDNKNKVSKADSKKLMEKLQIIDPDIVLLPQTKDVHPTHRTSRELTMDVLKSIGKRVELWNYESPWGLFNHGEFNSIVAISEKDFMTKIKAIKMHESQIERNQYDIVAASLAKLRGALIPEQDLFGFGKKKIKIHSNIELFYVEQLKL